MDAHTLLMFKRHLKSVIRRYEMILHRPLDAVLRAEIELFKVEAETILAKLEEPADG